MRRQRAKRLEKRPAHERWAGKERPGRAPREATKRIPVAGGAGDNFRQVWQKGG
jgi:hypothetical protein